MSYSIRIAKRSNIPAIENLISRSVRKLGATDYTPEQIEGALVAAWGVDTQLIDDKTYFAVEAVNELVGCGGWSFRETLFGNDTESDRNPAKLDPANDAAKIRAFFVEPAHTRRGIGSMVMRECEAAARAMGFRNLELMATLPGQQLYLSHGFTASEPVEYPIGGNLTITFVPMGKVLSD